MHRRNILAAAFAAAGALFAAAGKAARGAGARSQPAPMPHSMAPNLIAQRAKAPQKSIAHVHSPQPSPSSGASSPPHSFHAAAQIPIVPARIALYIPPPRFRPLEVFRRRPPDQCPRAAGI
jgi:hypothetical protein